MTTMEMTASIKQGKAMTTEKALREALENSTEMLRHCRCLDEEGAVAEQISENRAALSFPETVGEPVAKVADAPDAAPESVDEPAEKASEQIIGSDGKAFPQTFDAQAWAKAFNETLTVLGHPKHDEGWLIGWFANAIMRGFDEAHWRAASPSQPAQPAQGWVIAKEIAVLDDSRAVDGKSIGYALCEHSAVFPSFDAASAGIKIMKLPIGWVAIEVSRLLAAAPAAPTQEGWQPIATAPKDNGPMLIAGGHYCFDSGIGTAKTVNNEVALAYWDRFLNRFDEGYGDESKFWYEPTHWMPLPPPPNRPDPSSPQPDKPPTA